jgi:hypothetical protein
VRAGEPWPFPAGYVARRDVEFYRVGMPTPGLLVWPLTSGNALTSPSYSSEVGVSGMNPTYLSCDFSDIHALLVNSGS